MPLAGGAGRRGTRACPQYLCSRRSQRWPRMELGAAVCRMLSWGDGGSPLRCDRRRKPSEPHPTPEAVRGNGFGALVSTRTDRAAEGGGGAAQGPAHSTAAALGEERGEPWASPCETSDPQPHSHRDERAQRTAHVS